MPTHPVYGCELCQLWLVVLPGHAVVVLATGMTVPALAVSSSPCSISSSMPRPQGANRREPATSCHLVSSGRREGHPVETYPMPNCMWLMPARSASMAASEDWYAAQIILNAQPDRPADALNMSRSRQPAPPAAPSASQSARGVQIRLQRSRPICRREYRMRFLFHGRGPCISGLALIQSACLLMNGAFDAQAPVDVLRSPLTC